MSALLMTGFPGFLGSALLPRLLARREAAQALCVVQPRHMTTARQRLHGIEARHPHTRHRVSLVSGDITAPHLGLDPAARRAAESVTEVWHLAAVYDLTVPYEIARRVNVDGTARVLDLCASRERLDRLQYVSTCYVSGDYQGEFQEDSLDEGQTFRNHYESTKFDAEMLVRKAVAEGLPATVYRPGIVVGDSRSGETLKYDGPYFFATYLRRLPVVAALPAVREPDRVRVSLVPRDFVLAAMDELSVMDRSRGRTYALTDPDPPSAREVVDTFARHLGKRVVWLPVPVGVARAAVARIPGAEPLLGIPAEMLDYFESATTYSTTNLLADLRGTGVTCPRFETYAGRLLDYMKQHPEVGSSAMA